MDVYDRKLLPQANYYKDRYSNYQYFDDWVIEWAEQMLSSFDVSKRVKWDRIYYFIDIMINRHYRQIIRIRCDFGNIALTWAEIIYSEFH